MAIRIGEVDTEIVIEGGVQKPTKQGSDLRPETRQASLRLVVRELIREELERFMRTEARR